MCARKSQKSKEGTVMAPKAATGEQPSLSPEAPRATESKKERQTEQGILQCVLAPSVTM